MFEIPAELLSWFYGLTDSYIAAIALIAVVVMAITTPLTLKSTRGMLEMQRVAPEMRKLQNEYRNDKQKLNEEMMKLYQEHKVNPMSSCLPIAAQMPIFLIMFRVLRGLVYQPRGAALPVSQSVFKAFDEDAMAADPGFIPRYLGPDSALYESLFGQHEMISLGLDLSRSAVEAITDGFGQGIIYVLLVVFLGGLYLVQQRMVAARAAVSPTMSPMQQKLMQYLPVAFAVFQLFFLAALVVYYIFQTIIRIIQQLYITKAFYGHADSLGRQAQRAGEAAREEAKKSGEPGGLFSQAKRDLGAARGDGDAKGGAKDAGSAKREITSKRVTPNKKQQAAETPGKGRPTPSRKDANNGKSRPKSCGKKYR
ncbi:MAG: membrane protein insertase YidC [Acidimicrobiia bacterium]|nr:membrane protein insertase YidC [Acidimicrobiia bacterium]